MKHQTQPDPFSCTQTCLAMIMDTPVEEVLKRYPQPMGQWEMLKALMECGVIFNVISLGRLFFDGWYLVSAPSLNHAGAKHQLLVNIEDGRWWVLDPNRGRAGVKVYAEDGSNLTSWSEPVRVQRGGGLKPV